MKKSKNTLQKLSLFIGSISFLLSVVCVVALYMQVQENGFNNPVAMSFMASIFFFICVGGVLMVITYANIPSFNMKIEPQNKG